MKNHITQELILALSLALLFAACNSETKLPIVGAHSRAEQHLPADLQQPAPPQDRRHLPELDYRLNLVHLAALEHGEVAALALARELFLDVTAQGVLVQVNIRQGWVLDQVSDGVLRALGATPQVRGYSVMEARVPLSRLGLVTSGIPAVAYLEPPPDSHPDVGRETSQGVAKTFADRFHCRGITGKGIHVGVVDIGFSYWDKAELDGELPHHAGNPNNSNSYHGTACAEVVADMAPGVTLHPLMHSSLAKLEYFADNDLKKSGISILTRSLSSTGGGFGRATGAWCDLVKKINNMGVAWVNSAGNYGGGNFWRGTFKDNDNDGWHEFASGHEVNSFKLNGSSQITVGMDWDDYPASAEDFDLYIYKSSGGKWTIFASNKNLQTGTQEPKEYIKTKTAPAGTYGFAIYRKKGSKANVTLRAFKYSGGGDLSNYQRDRSINTASACPGVIAVAAVPQSRFFTGPQSESSSQGPSEDGRTKPEIASPTYVHTSVKSSFSGTSAAAPHVAGAIALYMEATGKDALGAAKLVISDAIPMGHPNPNNIYGAGRLALDGVRTGWQCGPKQEGPCKTSCGSTGKGTCGSSCTWTNCVPPAEVCNGKDDDCDKKIDEDGVCAGSPDKGTDVGADAAVTPAKDGGVKDEPEEEGCSCSAGGQITTSALPFLLFFSILLFRRKSQ